MNAFNPIRQNPIMDAALAASGGNNASATTILLKALSANEGDSDLGCLIHAILQAGPFCQRTHKSEWEDASLACDDVTKWAEALAEAWRMSADYYAEDAA
ncbi:hypothetical protein A8B82_21230 [Sulfitobacter sp. EhC04]|uniref:hypothetical protein n=1 Tax=Sulfitobacter sp. EhC04 TaxID=1849168 RepID=UPI0007F424FD|nr:hypothetical protein [Sulfitobacter sp. EhC04]OAN71118.1 hypothetical protein A8B82_21230 [Sulfitobacter sp. EhC04]